MTAATAWIFAAFLAALAVCLVMGWSATWAIVLGLALFFLLGMHRGLRPMELWKLAWEKGKQAIVILKILILIGVITGLWRASGTIAYCVYYGVQMIAPDLFVLLAFALTAVLSYALGTSFGVASTAGVIFMALARSGGVNEAVAAGAILSGVYFGDRCSPVSSSANLVAVVTGTSLYRNVRRMFVTALPAMGLILALYLLLSFQNPIAQVDRSVLEALESNFTMTLAALLPAAVILLLPLFRVPITWALTASLAAAAVVGWLVQGFSPAGTAANRHFRLPAEAGGAVRRNGGGRRHEHVLHLHYGAVHQPLLRYSGGPACSGPPGGAALAGYGALRAAAGHAGNIYFVQHALL